MIFPNLTVPAIALLVGSLGGWYFTQDVLNAKHNLELSRLNEASLTAINEQKTKVTNLERGLVQLSTEAEAKYVTKQKELDVANGKYSQLVANGFRLRDSSTSSTASSGSGNSSSTTINNGTGAGQLSRDATERLWSYATRADRITEKLTSCQVYSQTLVDYINVTIKSWKVPSK